MFRERQGSKGHDNIGEQSQIRSMQGERNQIYTMLNEGIPESIIISAIVKVGAWAKHFGAVRHCIFDMLGEREEGAVEDPVAKDLPRAVGETSYSQFEGMTNAVAYQPVDQDRVAKWKALYPDEYDV